MSEDDQIFDRARKLQRADRRAFLDRACGDDVERRQRIVRLLEADEFKDSLLDAIEDESLASTTEAVKQDA